MVLTTEALNPLHQLMNSMERCRIGDNGSGRQKREVVLEPEGITSESPPRKRKMLTKRLTIDHQMDIIGIWNHDDREL